MLADALPAEGFKVTVVDRRGPARSTTASTALVQYAIDTPLTKLRGRSASAMPIRAWRRARLAVDALLHDPRELGVDDREPRHALSGGQRARRRWVSSESMRRVLS